MIALATRPTIYRPTAREASPAPQPVERRLDDYARQWRSLCLPTDPPMAPTSSRVVRLAPERES